MAGAVAAAAAIAAVFRLSALTQCKARKKRCWEAKQRKTKEWLIRHPPKILRAKDIAKRVLKAQMIRREDEMQVAKGLWEDMRAPEQQWTIEQYRAWKNAPEREGEIDWRVKLGLPPPPIDLKKQAMEQIRADTRRQGRSSGASNATAGEEAAGEKAGDKKAKGSKKKEPIKKEDKFFDVSNIDEEFAELQGIVLSKQDKAQLAARQRNRAAALQKLKKGKR